MFQSFFKMIGTYPNGDGNYFCVGTFEFIWLKLAFWVETVESNSFLKSTVFNGEKNNRTESNFLNISFRLAALIPVKERRRKKETKENFLPIGFYMKNAKG